MCGLAGVAGHISTDEEKVFKDLLLISQLRGEDSTGIGQIVLGNRPHVLKTVENSTNFLQYDKRVDALFRRYSRVLIGHCRSATKGVVSRANAHPFLTGNILGAHNGTLHSSAARLEKEYGAGTDSENLYLAFADKGPKEVVSNLSASGDAYALTWYNIADDTINFLRNSQRPLYLFFTDDNKTIFWASEKGFLVAALDRNNIKGFKPEKIQELPADKYMKFKVPSVSTAAFEEPVVETLTGKSYVYSFNRYKGKSSFYKNDDNDKGDKEDKIDDELPFLSGAKKNDGKTGPINKNLGARVTYTDPECNNDRYSATFTSEESNKDPFSGRTGGGCPSKLKFPQPREGDTLLYRTGTSGQDIYSFYFNSKLNRFRLVRYLPHNKNWVVTFMVKPPLWIPLKHIDIRARHNFKWERIRISGTKKRKKFPFYRGYQGELLSKDAFESIMKNGCSICGRVPEWGNEVHFYSKDGSFICPYCGARHDFKAYVDAVGKTI